MQFDIKESAVNMPVDYEKKNKPPPLGYAFVGLNNLE